MRNVVVSAQLLLIAVMVTACSNAGNPIAPTQIPGVGLDPVTSRDTAGGGSSSSQGNALSGSEQSLASYVATNNQGLLGISALEKSNGELPEVKAFASQIFQDLTAAQEDLRDISGNQSQSISMSSSDQQ